MMDEEEYNSNLGKVEHWDQVYKQELENFSNFGDEGEIWFGKEVQKKIIKSFLESCGNSVNKSCSVLDIGMGNGIFLFMMAMEGFDRLFGFDYSYSAVEFAKLLFKTKLEKNELNKTITFDVFQYDLNDYAKQKPEISGENNPLLIHSPYEIIHDKGSYDAIQTYENIVVDNYYDVLNQILAPNGYFLITSCNYTKDELMKYFLKPNSCLEFVLEVPHRSFQFGGSSGNTVTSLIFRKK
jgi:SAM-dependent methyltransferase